MNSKDTHRNREGDEIHHKDEIRRHIAELGGLAHAAAAEEHSPHLRVRAAVRAGKPAIPHSP